MIEKITADDLKAAMDKWDAGDVPQGMEARESGAIDIAFEGRRYPPGVILEMAWRSTFKAAPSASQIEFRHVDVYRPIIQSRLGNVLRPKWPAELKDVKITGDEWLDEIERLDGVRGKTIRRGRWRISVRSNAFRYVMIKWEGDGNPPGHPSDSTRIHDQDHDFSRWCLPQDLKSLLDELELLENPSSFIKTISELESSLATNQSLSDTEKLAIVKQRIGQGPYRTGLLSLWNGCSVTGIKSAVLLVASHIKPWRESNDDERIDRDNGLLLTPHLDRLFDRYLMSFEKDGSIVLSQSLLLEELAVLGIHAGMQLSRTNDRLENYMSHHRSKFREQEQLRSKISTRLPN